MSNSIDFAAAFVEAQATTPFDKLIATMNLATRAVKAERDRLTKDADAQTKFDAAVINIHALTTQMQENPAMINDYLEAGTEMRRANTTRLAREEKSIPQWESITQCFEKA